MHARPCVMAAHRRPASRGGITARVFLAGVALRFPCVRVRPLSRPPSPPGPPAAGHAGWIPPARIIVQIRRHLAPATPWGPGSRTSLVALSSSSSARIAARSQRTPCLHVPAGDAPIIRPASACSPRQKLQPHQAVSRLPPHLLLSDAGGPRSGE